MAKCQGCERMDISPMHMAFEPVSQKVLCPECLHIGLENPVAPGQLKYSIGLDSDTGFKAKVQFGDLVFETRASNEELKKLLGMKRLSDGR